MCTAATLEACKFLVNIILFIAELQSLLSCMARLPVLAHQVLRQPPDFCHPLSLPDESRGDALLALSRTEGMGCRGAPKGPLPGFLGIVVVSARKLLPFCNMSTRHDHHPKIASHPKNNQGITG
jgi:hypothetical protein